MPTEREKLVRDIDSLKERVRLVWLDMISKPVTSAERQELRKSIESLVKELFAGSVAGHRVGQHVCL
jgi:hypothetical protein